MEWNLSPIETAGVVVVGLGLGAASNFLTNKVESPESHKIAMLAGGAVLYTLGVIIGSNRPEQGWQVPMLESKQ